VDFLSNVEFLNVSSFRQRSALVIVPHKGAMDLA